MLKLVKRSWESPELCAARLARLLALPRWREPGAPTPWYVEELASPWPDACDRARDDVLAAVGAAIELAQGVGGKKAAPSATA